MTIAYIIGILLFLLAAFGLKRTQNKVEKRMFGDLDLEIRDGVSPFDRIGQQEVQGTDAEKMASPAARKAAAMAAAAEKAAAESEMTAEEKVAAAEESARAAEREAAEKFAAETSEEEEDW